MKYPPLISPPGYKLRRILQAPGLVAAFCLAWALDASAAAPPGWPAVTTAEKQYVSRAGRPEAAVVLFESGEVDDTPSGRRIQTIHRRLKILTTEGIPRSRVRINYVDPGQDLIGLEGRTVTPQGRVILLDGNSISKSRTPEGVAEVTFQFPEVSPGSIVEYRYTLRGGSPPAISGWTFQHEIPCLRSTFTWHPSLGRTSHWTLVNADSLHPDVTVLASEAVPESLSAVQFEIGDVPAVPVEVMGPPEIETRARLVTTYTDFAAPAADYWDSFAAASRQRQELFLSQKERVTAELRGGTAPPEDFDARIRKAYDFVQSRIRLRTDFGSQTSRPPSTADSVLALGAADPDGCDLLFIAALQVLGIEATRAFVVDRDQAFFHKEIQSPAQFSHALVAVTPGNGQAFFFSPGTPFAPPGIIPWYEQGVTTLIAASSGALFAVTPVDLPTANQTKRSATFEVDEKGRLTAAVHVDYTGQPELEARLLNAGNREGLRTGLEQEWRRRMPRAVIDSVKVLNAGARDRNLALDVHLETEGFGVLADDRILINPAILGKLVGNPFPPGPRVNPVYFDYPNASTDNVTITLPGQWKLEALPEPVDFENEVGSYRTFWSFDGEHVVYQRTFVVNAARVPPEQYQALRTLYDRGVQGDNMLVPLVRSPSRPSKR